MEKNEPVVVYTAGHYAQAALMKSLLDASGIQCLMLDAEGNNTAGSGAFYAIEIRLVVPSSQAEEARAIITEADKGLE